MKRQATYAGIAQLKEHYRAAMAYQSDEQLLDELLDSERGWKQVVLCEVLKQRGHADLVSAWHNEDLTKMLKRIDDVFSRL